MLLILGSFRLPAENVALARPIMRRMIEASRAEDGCIAYAYAQDVLDPGLIRVHEVWRDQTALDRHFTTPHILEWRATWPQLRIHDRNLTRHALASGEPT
jgi:quinol monooxygenase YgiN